MKLFISYRRSDDHGAVGRLFDHLEGHFGRGNVFLDVDSNMPLGVDFRDHIAKQIEKSDVVLAVIGPNWLKLIQENTGNPKDFVRVEIEVAMQQGKPVVPVLMGGSVPEEEELPPTISRLSFLNGMPVDVGADFRHHAKTLCSKLAANPNNQSSQSGAPPNTQSSKPDNALKTMWEDSKRFGHNLLSRFEGFSAKKNSKKTPLDKKAKEPQSQATGITLGLKDYLSLLLWQFAGILLAASLALLHVPDDEINPNLYILWATISAAVYSGPIVSALIYRLGKTVVITIFVAFTLSTISFLCGIYLDTIISPHNIMVIPFAIVSVAGLIIGPILSAFIGSRISRRNQG